ncbi:MAG: DUF4386 family protein [Chloroflexota bacterium]
MMNSVFIRRFGAATGIAYILLLVLQPGGGGSNTPNFHASRQAVATWIHHQPGRITAGQFIGGVLELLALLLFLIFVVYLASVIRDGEGEFHFLSTIALSAGILSVAIKITSFPAALVALVSAHDGVDPRVIGMLLDMNDVAFILALAATGLMLATVAAVAIPTRVLPPWLAWGTMVVALAMFANVALSFLGPDFAPSMLLFMLWTVVTSAVLIGRAGGSAAVPTSAAREPEFVH